MQKYATIQQKRLRSSQDRSGGTTLHRPIPWLGAVLTAVFAIVAWGQADKPAEKSGTEPDSIRLKYVIEVVTDTKIPQEQKNVTQKVTVLDSTDFSQLTTVNRNIAESGISGIYCQDAD